MCAYLDKNEGKIVVEQLAQLGDGSIKALSIGVRSLWVSDDIIFAVIKD